MPATTTPGPAGAGADRPLILLDGMSLAFRAYFALPDTLKTSAGVTTNAVHGFTNAMNGNDPKGGLAYNESADLRSWEAFKQFLRELFK